MKYIIISFKSRNSLQKFVQILKTNRINCKIINTPHMISSSCSLSAKIDCFDYFIAIEILKKWNFDDLIGVFLMNQTNFTNKIQKLM